MPKDKIRMSDLEWSRNMWSRIKSILTGHDNRISALEQGGGGGGQMNTIESISLNGTNVPPDANKNVALVEADPTVPSWAKANSKPSYTASEITDAVTGVKGNAESTYRTGDINLTPGNIGAKAAQTAVSDPTASGTSVTFIDSITQDSQGVITPTKKTVRSASQSVSGLMSATDKTKLDGIATGAQVNSVTGVKGDSESTYRTGDINLTPANIGALGTGSLSSSLTDANNTGLYGTNMLSAASCSNLPTSTQGHYYEVAFLGTYQMAVLHSGSEGAARVYARYYANSQWYPWVRVDGLNKVSLSDVILASGTYTFSDLAAGAQTSHSISASIGTTNYIVLTQSNVSRCAIGIQNRASTGFELYCRNVSPDTSSPVITWAAIAIA